MSENYRDSSKFEKVEDLSKFKENLKKQNLEGLALDIDETLSFTLLHWFTVMNEKFGNPENLNVVEIIKKYRYAKDVPYWQTPEAHKWMDEARFSNDLQEELPLIEGANTSVQKLNKIEPIQAYLTIRPAEVAEGTIKWLIKHNFPPAAVISRPANLKHEEGVEWKAKTLDFLYPQIKGIVDDQPLLVEKLPKGYKGKVFLYNSTVSPRKDIDVVPCLTWSDVIARI